MTPRTFNPGFRFSKLDAILLIFGGILSADTASVVPWLGGAMAFVIAHFFLFCNVVRMERSRELAWAGLFVAFAFSTSQTGWPSWPITFALAFVVSALLVVLEMRKPSYHGVFWRQINPGLLAWWKVQAGSDQEVQ